MAPASAEELLEAEKLLDKSHSYTRFKELRSKQDLEGLTLDEEEELRAIVTPKFQEGDVIQEFVRDLEAAKAKEEAKNAQ